MRGIDLETVKVIHIANKGFAWKYQIKADPNFPDDAILIQDWEDEKMVAEVSIPRDAVPSLIEALVFYKTEVKEPS